MRKPILTVELLELVGSKQFCIRPLLEGDQGGELYVVAREQELSGGITVVRLRDRGKRWIREVDICGFRESRDAENFGGTLELQWPLAVGGHGICYRKKLF
jgi:hypothetical protein